MNFKDSIRASLGIADFLVQKYLEDITPQEMLQRPAPDANHIAWQLGHLISAERRLVEAAVPGSMPPLPDGFAERHSKDTAASDNPADFLSKDEYFKLAADMRARHLKGTRPVERSRSRQAGHRPRSAVREAAPATASSPSVRTGHPTPANGSSCAASSAGRGCFKWQFGALLRLIALAKSRKVRSSPNSTALGDIQRALIQDITYDSITNATPAMVATGQFAIAPAQQQQHTR